MERLGVVILACLAAVACGGTDSPSGPSAATTRASSVTVTLPDVLIVGQSQQATASAALAGGGTQAVTSGFRSDVPSVATVSDAGLVTPVANGLANIYVIYGGQQGTRPIRVVPGMQGQWRGSYVVRNCTQTGVFAQAPTLCDQLGVNRVLPVTMSVSQTLDNVTGQFQLGTAQFSPFSSRIGGDGAASFTSASMDTTSLSVQVTWRITSPQDGRLTGTHSQVWRVAGQVGEGRIDADVVDWLNRVSPSPLAAAMAGAHAGSIQALIRGILQR